MKTDVLYYGDNLEILRKYVPDGSVDLVYLDPPFNSNADYNVIFKDESGRKSDALLLAFEDTWHGARRRGAVRLPDEHRPERRPRPVDRQHDRWGVLEREGAEIGLFVTLNEPSAPMRLEASTAGAYHSNLSGRDYQRIQILTIAELLEEHRRPDLPLLVLPTYQRAERVEKKAAEQAALFGE